MRDRHPDVSDEDLGIRAFKLQRAKSVERAIERLRHGLGNGWADLTADEIGKLEFIFGELWAFMPRAEWSDLRFGMLSMSDTIKIIVISGQVKRHALPAVDGLREVRDIVRARSESETPADA